MQNRPRPEPSDSQELVSWKAREYDRRNLETQEILVEKVERIERELIQFKAKLAVVTVLGSSVATVLIHLLAKYLKLA